MATIGPKEPTEQNIENIAPNSENIEPNKITELSQKTIREKQKALKKEQKLERKRKAEATKHVNVYVPKIYDVKGKDILALKFSQDSISEKTKDGILLEELIKNMKEKGWKKGIQLEVVKMPDDSLVALNNRRLYAAQKVLEENPYFSVKVAQFDHSIKAPQKLLRGIQAEYSVVHGAQKIEYIAHNILPNTYGECAITRIQTRQKTNEVGFSKPPTVRHDEKSDQ